MKTNEFQKLKLYVWAEFEPEWSDGLAFAIAETEEEAKELVLNGCTENRVHWWGNVEVLDIHKVARSVTGGG